MPKSLKKALNFSRQSVVVVVAAFCWMTFENHLPSSEKVFVAARNFKYFLKWRFSFRHSA